MDLPIQLGAEPTVTLLMSCFPMHQEKIHLLENGLKVLKMAF